MRKRSWSVEQLKRAVLKSTSVRQIINKLGLKPAGGNYQQINKYINDFRINIGHLKGRGWNKGLRGIGKPTIPLDRILIKNSNFQSYMLKKRLFTAKLKRVECEFCGWKEKSADGRIPLELAHINGNRNDNRFINLRILCPNCHSLQPTHRGLNSKK